jgi:uncharacterized protein YebE (UPF0316 family)
LILTCLEIFAARIVDVSLGTLRTVFFVKGKTFEPFIIAFFEVLIWYAVAKEALNATGNTFLIATSYAGGYATGTFIGSYLSKKLIKENICVQVITSNTKKILNVLRNNGYGVSVIELKNGLNNKEKSMLYIEVKSNSVKKLNKIILKYDKNAFIVGNETKYVYNGFIK